MYYFSDGETLAETNRRPIRLNEIYGIDGISQRVWYNDGLSRNLFSVRTSRFEDPVWYEKIVYKDIDAHTEEEDIVAEDLCELTGGIYCKQ